jgi:hypothetical protein
MSINLAKTGMESSTVDLINLDRFNFTGEGCQGGGSQIIRCFWQRTSATSPWMVTNFYRQWWGNGPTDFEFS